MHLAHLRLRDFRNYAYLDVDFGPGLHLLLGPNAQGKTNVLEAIYLLATLRSFRGVGGAQMVRQGAKGYFVGATISATAEHDIKIYWSVPERKLTLDGTPVKRLSDFFGIFRAVVFCSEDLFLVKGPGSRRRRFLDLLLAQSQPVYLPLLQRYAQALRARNALLKQRSYDPDALEGFSQEVVNCGTQITEFRRQLLPKLAPLAARAYARIARDQERLDLEYRPSVKANFAVELAQARSREQTFRSTIIGPHRDELQLSLNGRSAGQFGSEGQKRSIAIALKMAQAEFLTDVHGSPPVLLIDDIMGELDASRRAGFLPLLHRSGPAQGQVFMTATEENWAAELGEGLIRWEVKQGTVKRVK